MSNLTKGLILLLVILGIGAGLVVWKNKVGGHGEGSFNEISREEIELLLADVGKANPMAMKRLAEDQELRKQQLESLKQLLAFASQAKREGLADEPTNRQELENIRSQVVASYYDQHMNEGKGPMPQFGFISEEQVKKFWGQDEFAPSGFWPSLKDKVGLGPSRHELEFQKFFDSKVALLKASNPQMADREITEEEKGQAREIFAKVEIYQDEYESRKNELPEEFRKKVDLQVKLQQAQFLARLFSDKAADRIKVTDEEVEKYIAEHPELNMAEKRTKAEEILNRAKSGESFEALANEFSEDPGNKDPATGQGKGGLYANTPKGRMVAEFEQAALALEPGQIAQNLVETDFGFHIIKLDRKGTVTGADGQPSETYDVRHILISTGYKDPENPLGRDEPLKQYVRRKLEEEKQKKLIDDIVAANHVEVPDDFSVPQISDEEIQKMMQERMPQGMPGEDDEHGEEGPPAAKPEAPKPAPKKGQ